MRIDDGVYVCKCTFCSYISKQFTQHAFVLDSHFSEKQKIACCGTIIDNISYELIYVLEEKYRESKHTLKNMIRSFLEGICIVKYALKVTSHDYPYNIPYLLGFDSSVWNTKDRKKSYINLLENWFGYDTILE